MAENVKIASGGRMTSACGTHLGHNIPDYNGDRYCIDLLCISGTGTSTGQETTTDGMAAGAHDETDL